MDNIELNLNEFISSQEQSLRRLLGDGISFQATLATKPARINAEESTVIQIVAALLEQARQRLPGGGAITLLVEQLEVDDIHARIQPGARRGEFVRLTVSDNGLGLRPEELKRLLEEPAAARNGQVLSLPLVAGVIKRRQGWIEAASQAGAGTMLAVYLPVSVAAAGTPVNVPVGAAKVTETILLVDDEAPIRRMVKSVLQRASYDVIEAESGVQALSIWEAHKERVDLLLTDMVMPDGVTGRELAHQLQRSKPGLNVIYTSGYHLDAEASRDTNERGIHFLQKPYDMRKLLDTVHLAIGGKNSAMSRPTSAVLPA
jgi:CheY-like chemotaxis protein